jgi:hypothetical protein
MASSDETGVGASSPFLTMPIGGKATIGALTGRPYGSNHAGLVHPFESLGYSRTTP